MQKKSLCFLSVYHYVLFKTHVLYIQVHEILRYVKKAIADGIVQNVFMDRITKDLAKEKVSGKTYALLRLYYI